MKLYLLPFRDRIYLELRRPAADADPGRKFAWRLKDWAVYSALPEAARSIGMAVPIRQIRYPLIDSLSEVAQTLVNNALVRSGSNSVEQSGRYRMLGNKSRFTYTTWAFPAGEFANTALAYKLFCKEYYARTGFRCDMPAVGFRLNRDRSALLSPSFDTPMFTISPLSTQVDGWDDFVLDFADFAARNHGVPFFNQTRNASPEIVAQRFGTRLAFFNKVRRELDPHDRLVNSFFQAYLPQDASCSATALFDEAERLELDDDAMRRHVRRRLRRVEPHLRVLRRLVRIVDARKAFESAGARLRIEALAIARLADLDRRRDMDLDEAAERLDHLAHDLARRRSTARSARKSRCRRSS